MAIKNVTNVTVTLRDKNGCIINKQDIHNMVVNPGLANIAKNMGTGNANQYKYMELDQGGTSTFATLNKLVNFITSRARAIVSQGNYSASWTHTWTKTELSKAGILGAGLFFRQTNNATGMLARLRFATVNKTNSDTLTINWEVGVADDGV